MVLPPVVTKEWSHICPQHRLELTLTLAGMGMSRFARRSKPSSAACSQPLIVPIRLNELLKLIHRQTCMRDAWSAARLDLNTTWKAQAPANSVWLTMRGGSHNSAASPGQWGVDRIAKQCWSNHRSYRSGPSATGSELPPHPRCHIHCRSTSRSDSDSCNSTPVADHGNDNEDRNDGDEEDLEDSTLNGKKRAAPVGESDNRKQQRRQ
ncbi:hypothetical protein B0H14DRAFT_2652596 [Mycena olivaceomarginata]|nr:hypothetical protein B0H14DRAFT_2652596 [Mycena olivaceomarginata]